MKWSLDTHKFLSEIVRTALKVVVDRKITSLSDDTIVKAAEHELAEKGVYRSKEAAEGRIKRALLTYFKAYNLMTQDCQLTEIGKAFYEDQLSVKELCLHFLYHYKYIGTQTNYYPLEIILGFTDYCSQNVPEANHISLEDFDELVNRDSKEEAAYSSTIQKRSENKTVDARSIGYDVWTYMLLESGLYIKNEDKQLVPNNLPMIRFLLASYRAGKTDSVKGCLSGGYLSLVPAPQCSRKNVKESEIVEAKTISAFLFDEIDLQTIDKLVCPKGTSVSLMIRKFGLDENAKGTFIKFSGYEHLVSRAWMQSTDELVRLLGTLIASMQKGIVEPCVLFEYSTDEEDEAEVSPEWFKKQAASLAMIDKEADTLYKEFQSLFAPSILKTLTNRDLLEKFFYSDKKDERNLCYTLEHDPRFNLFGGVKGGSSYKFGLFYSKDHSSWVTGSPKKIRQVSENEAILIGSSIRDELVAGAEVIANYGELNDLTDYADLYAKVFKVMPNLINKMWVLKYLHMMFPTRFPVFYNSEWQNDVIDRLGMEPKEDTFTRMGQIALFVKKCGISNVAFSKVIYKLKADPSLLTEKAEEETLVTTFAFDTKKGGAQNRVVYGTPGCGKSFYVQNKYLAKCGVPTENRIRTTFYMDYTNTDFVGQILPKLKPNGEVTYEFNPGPFALALKMAIENPDDAVALIIEELNRGNAASIFGDIFQLLDRDTTGKSQYSITNVNLQNYLNKCFENVYTFSSISIPANLYIVATMNTSDQNVFTLDTAFKRRWQFEKIRNEFSDEHEYKDYFIPGMAGITWKMLVTAVNNYIVNRPDDLASEDKQLGVYFIDKATLCETEEDITDETKIDRFAFKLFEYLWDDVAKYAHSDWFSSDIKTLDALIDNYKKLGAKVFADGVLDL